MDVPAAARRGRGARQRAGDHRSWAEGHGRAHSAAGRASPSSMVWYWQRWTSAAAERIRFPPPASGGSPRAEGAESVFARPPARTAVRPQDPLRPVLNAAAAQPHRLALDRVVPPPVDTVKVHVHLQYFLCASEGRLRLVRHFDPSRSQASTYAIGAISFTPRPRSCGAGPRAMPGSTPRILPVGDALSVPVRCRGTQQVTNNVGQ
jgi:hypothetical protein